MTGTRWIITDVGLFLFGSWWNEFIVPGRFVPMRGVPVSQAAGKETPNVDPWLRHTLQGSPPPLASFSSSSRQLRRSSVGTHTPLQAASTAGHVRSSPITACSSDCPSLLPARETRPDKPRLPTHTVSDSLGCARPWPPSTPPAATTVVPAVSVVAAGAVASASGTAAGGSRSSASSVGSSEPFVGGRLRALNAKNRLLDTPLSPARALVTLCPPETRARSDGRGWDATKTTTSHRTRLVVSTSSRHCSTHTPLHQPSHYHLDKANAPRYQPDFLSRGWRMWRTDLIYQRCDPGH